MRSPLLPALALLVSATACVTGARGAMTADATEVYETRARAGERVEAPMRMAAGGAVKSARDPRDAIRVRADEVSTRSVQLSERVSAARAGAARTLWRDDLDVVADRVQRLQERMAILDQLERRNDGMDVERQWDGVFAEVQDLLAVLDELEVDLDRATGPAGGSAQRAAP